MEIRCLETGQTHAFTPSTSSDSYRVNGQAELEELEGKQAKVKKRQWIWPINRDFLSPARYDKITDLDPT